MTSRLRVTHGELNWSRYVFHTSHVLDVILQYNAENSKLAAFYACTSHKEKTPLTPDWSHVYAFLMGTRQSRTAKRGKPSAPAHTQSNIQRNTTNSVPNLGRPFVSANSVTSVTKSRTSIFGSRNKSKARTRPRDSPFRECGGRRFHNDSTATYFFPSDEEEINRMDQLHYLLRSVLGRNYSAELERNPPRDTLDIGTGTGIWILVHLLVNKLGNGS